MIFYFIIPKSIGSIKKKTYHIHQMDENYKCFHCDAIGSQKIYKSIERYCFLTIPTPIRRTTYFTRCSAEGCNGETELTRETAEFMRLALYDSLEDSDVIVKTKTDW